MDSPLFRRFSHLIPSLDQTKMPDFEWEFEGRDLLLRPREGDLPTVWAYLGQAHMGALMLRERTARTRQNQIRRAYNSRQFWRAWPVGDDETVYLRGNFGLLGRNDERDLARFELPRGTFKNALEVYEADAARIAALMAQLENDAASDWHAARRWREWRDDLWADLRFVRGSRAELEAVLRALAHLLLDAGQSERWQWFGRDTPDKSALSWNIVFASQLFGARDPQQIERIFELLTLAMQTAFEVRIEGVWRDYDRQPAPTKRRLPQLKFTPPTMHEKLEAQLFLRDWLRDKIAPADATWLLLVASP